MTGLKLLFYRLLPKGLTSRLMGWFSGVSRPRLLVRAVIRLWVRAYKVDLSEIEVPPGGFKTLGEFFIRPFKEGARPLEGGEESVACPVDGRLLVSRRAERGTLIQAKGLGYTLEDLLEDPEMADRFEGGCYMTLYLSPRDYHRIHAPLSGEVRGFRHSPGRLYPVNETGMENVGLLLPRNERLITYLDTAWGVVGVVKVGAMCVGRIRLAYDDAATRSGRSIPRFLEYGQRPRLARGDELGRFEIGSTVVLLFEPGRFVPREDLEEGQAVRVGLSLGKMEGAS